jgi:hypothetical protein
MTKIRLGEQISRFCTSLVFTVAFVLPSSLNLFTLPYLSISIFFGNSLIYQEIIAPTFHRLIFWLLYCVNKFIKLMVQSSL